MTAPAAVVLPVSVVIPTRHRPDPFRRTLESLAGQSAQPAEVVVVDASDDDATAEICRSSVAGLRSELRWVRATHRGAAVQRNEGVALAVHSTIGFFDDDILFEPECVARLWAALDSDPKLGGVNTTITNLRYTPPGPVTRMVYPLLAGRALPTYAGRVFGPGVNVVSDDRPDQPDVVAVDWLSTTCTLYRRGALPDPPFASHFTGYSMCEDLTLSLVVARGGWKLANARTARIFHDSQPGDHKRSAIDLSVMELVNRHYVMTTVLGRTSVADYLKLAVWEGFQTAASARTGIRHVAAVAVGKLLGLGQVIGFPPGRVK